MYLRLVKSASLRLNHVHNHIYTSNTAEQHIVLKVFGSHEKCQFLIC